MTDIVGRESFSLRWTRVLDSYSSGSLANFLKRFGRCASPVGRDYENVARQARFVFKASPSQRQSADDTFHGHITRQGNKYICWIVIEAAQHGSRFDPKLRNFYLHVAARRERQRAIVAVARKLLIYIYQVLTKQEPYKTQRNDLLEKRP
jgi:hypothetical protein